MVGTVKKISLVTLALCLTAIGAMILSIHKLTFGGTAGIAFLLSYATPFSWSFWFVVVNLPFFLLSFRLLGRWFTLSTLFSIVGISSIREMLDLFAFFTPVMHPIAASITSGVFIGVGLALVLNNGSSLGGIQIFALVLDRKFQINRGISIFISDVIIIVSAAFLLGWSKALASILSIAVASLIIGRYKKTPLFRSLNVYATSEAPKPFSER
jgi:uncharacterized membrane-anchored protein YitT (DUF2179 family)